MCQSCTPVSPEELPFNREPSPLHPRTQIYLLPVRPRDEHAYLSSGRDIARVLCPTYLRRIVACVNACVDCTTEELEKIAAKKGVPCGPTL
jgi:hypothetical protein